MPVSALCASGSAVDTAETESTLASTFTGIGLQKSLMVAYKQQRTSCDQLQDEAAAAEAVDNPPHPEEPSAAVRNETAEEAEGFTRSISLYWHWVRGQKAAARVGKGLARSDTALILQCEHWLEAADPKHRYGTNLRPYFDYWLNQQAKARDATTTRHTYIPYSAIPEIAAQAAAEASSQANNNNAEALTLAEQAAGGSGAACEDAEAAAGTAPAVTPRRSRSAPSLADVARTAAAAEQQQEAAAAEEAAAAAEEAAAESDAAATPGGTSAAADHAGFAISRSSSSKYKQKQQQELQHQQEVLLAALQPAASINLGLVGRSPAPLPGIHTDDRFFYWLDEGSGRHVDLSDRGVPRGKLESERVQYLTESERNQLEVTVDASTGLLVYKVSSQTVHTGSELSVVQLRASAIAAEPTAAPAAPAAAAAVAGGQADSGAAAAGSSGADGCRDVLMREVALEQIPEAAAGEEDEEEDVDGDEPQEEEDEQLGPQRKQQQWQQLQQMQQDIRQPSIHIDRQLQQHLIQQHLLQEHQQLSMHTDRQQQQQQQAVPGQAAARRDSDEDAVMEDTEAAEPAAAAVVLEQPVFCTPAKGVAVCSAENGVISTPSAAAYGSVAGHATPGTTCVSQQCRAPQDVTALPAAAAAAAPEPFEAAQQQQQQLQLPQPAQQQEQQQQAGVQPCSAAPGGPADGVLQIKEKPCKWIYVLDTSKRLFVHAKYRGKFHHSSFLQGGAVLSAGGIVVEHGRILKLTADSGHYRPNFDSFMSTVQLLKDWGADLTQTKLSAKHIKCPQLPDLWPA